MTKIIGLLWAALALSWGDVTGPVAGLDEATGLTLKVDSTGNPNSTTFSVYAIDNTGAVSPLAYNIASQTVTLDGYLVYKGQSYYVGKTLAEDLLLTAKLTSQ